jgi:hypothetical protein
LEFLGGRYADFSEVWGFGGEGAGGLDGAGEFVRRRVEAGSGQRAFLVLPIFLFLAP